MRHKICYKSPYSREELNANVYVPQRWGSVNKQQIEENYMQYIPAEVKHLVAAVYNSYKNELVQVFEPGPGQLRSMYESCTELWLASEKHKMDIEQEIKARRAQYDPRLPLGKQHRSGGKIVSLYPVNAQKLVKTMNLIHKTIESVFAPKVPVSYMNTPRKLQLVNN